jgi:hypothetical protein
MDEHWNPTGDQFIYQPESVFPTFSDIDTSDFNLAVMQPRGAVKVLTPEGKLRASQFGLPAYVQNCQCANLPCGQNGSCPAEYAQSYAGFMPKNGQKVPTYLDVIDSNTNVSSAQSGKETMADKLLEASESAITITIDDDVITWLLLFILIVFVCCCCKKYLHSMMTRGDTKSDRDTVPVVISENTVEETNQ